MNISNKNWVNVNYTVDFPNIDKYGIKASKNVQINTELFHVNDSEISYLISKEDISPCLLTDEILIANGFEKFIDGILTTLFRQQDDNDGNEKYNINVYRIPEKDKYYSLEITNMDPFASLAKRVMYVDEFQDALRVCHLNELADNIKMK